MEVNEFQTPITDELLNSLLPEIKDQFLDYINSIEFIRRLISPNRKRAKDLLRDSEGKIIVDVCNPHILEDMEYFRPTGNHYRKYGTLTDLRPNGNPNSQYGKWLKLEIHRIWYGMVRPSDGEWITGDMYFYLNYTPIILTKIKEGSNTADRVVDFPEVWEGIYLWFHCIYQARNGGLYNDFKGGYMAGEIAKRGASKSYSGASKLGKLFICGENELSSKNTRGVIMASKKEYLIKDGTLNKFIDIIDFCAKNTLFPRRRLKDSLSEMQWKMGYKDVELGVNKGTGNETLGVAINDDPDKGRGKRANLLYYEEFGSFPKFIDTWNVNMPSVKEGDYAFGLAIFIGTGGDEGSSFEGALEMIYNPIGYGVYALPNVFDKNSLGKLKTIFFFGAYLNRKGCYNKDGVSDVVKALIQILKERYKLKYNSSDPNSLTRSKAENPITIQEAIMKRTGTIYPVSDLQDLLNSIDLDPKSLDFIYCGDLTLVNGRVEYKMNPDKKPNRVFPHHNNKLVGCCEILQMPVKKSDGTVIRGRYIGGIDTMDDDASDTLSLGSIFILDLFTDEIVFEYTGRDLFASDFYEICRRALLFYNAEANYENNKKGLFSYFSKHNCLYLLSTTLEFLKDKDTYKPSYGNKMYGTLSTAPIKQYGRKCIRNWLLKPYTLTIDGKEIQTPLLYKLRNRALIQELILWNPDGNFDRHDALVQLMLLREDKLRLCGETDIKDREKIEDDYLGKDDFFEKNFKGKNSDI